MADGDRAWLAEALGHWRVAETELLALEPQALPQVVAIDADCTFTLPAGDLARMKAVAHGDKVQLPDGGAVPVGPISFASFEGEPFFAMSLPSVWREAGVTSVLGLERLLHGVLLHEMAHTRQTEIASELVRDLATEAGFKNSADLTDDLVQESFGDNAEYVAQWQVERDLFFAAAVTRDDGAARLYADRAFAMMKARHARWFTGKKAAFKELDGIFLTMEGMGQWLAYRFFQSPAGGNVPARDALPAVRRGGGQWSQDQGLAIIMVVERFLPDWQKQAFSDPGFRADRLLAAALENAPAR